MTQLTPQQTTRMTKSRLSNAITPLFIFLARLVPTTVLVLIVLVVAEFVSMQWPGVSLPLYGLLIVLSLLLALRSRWYAHTYFASETVDQRRVWSAVLSGQLVAPCTVAFVVCCGQFLRAWQRLFGGFAAPAGMGYWDWVRYSLSWALDNTLANAGQIFGWELTSVRPVSTEAQLLVFGYNLVLEFFLLALLLRLLRIFSRLRGRDIVIA
jgi:hypothetical protein